VTTASSTTGTPSTPSSTSTTVPAQTAKGTGPDLAAVKAKQQKTWASGDYSVVASRIVIIAEQLVDSAALPPGSRVLDVACGSGNATIAAARQGAHVVGVDYVPALLEDGRARAVAEGIQAFGDAEFRLGDAEDLPVEDASFDAAISVVGSMFAPDHKRTAEEMVRATRSGGTIALASWTPTGFIGQMFRIVGKHVAPPAGVQSPLLWGTPGHLDELFGDHVRDVRSTERTFTWRFTDPEELVAYFRRYYGPTLKAFEQLDDAGQQAFTDDLVALCREWDTHADSRCITLPATYLETVMTRC
jgi:SAM-dependent methyltransferase